VQLPPITLTIAGSDPSGGAGIQADLKTFHQLRVYGTSVITLLTVQNTQRVSRVMPLAPEFVLEQLRAVLEDLPPVAAKTGALGSAAVVEALAGLLAGLDRPFPLVVDPVMISKHGASLIDADARSAVRERLLPLAALVTPNLHEAAELAGIPVENPTQMREAAARIAQFGPAAVLIKGGHLDRHPECDAIDILLHQGTFTEFRSARFQTKHTHGTGCTYSAAITAYLARGLAMEPAIAAAKTFISEAIRTAPGLGAGCGPVNHWATGAGSL
jgi:hydroxymethylpyrimidine/phosphomethylpyrimidine kinase